MAVLTSSGFSTSLSPHSKQRVLTWLKTSSGSHSDEAAIPRSIATPPDSNPRSTIAAGHERLKRRLREKYMDATELPRKRDRREAQRDTLNDGARSFTSPSGRQILSPKSRSQTSNPRRPVSPTRDLLHLLRVAKPRIDCQQTTIEIPGDAIRLRSHLSKRFGESVIPVELKDDLRGLLNPLDFYDIPDYAYDQEFKGSEHSMRRLWDEVKRIYIEAEECNSDNQDENAWCMQVVQRVLSWGTPVSGKGFLIPKSIQSQSIDPAYLPSSTTGIPVSKKADYALAFSARIPTTASLYSDLDREGYKISQMTDTHTSRIAMAFGVEVKPAGGDGQEALAQLAIWIAAGFTHILSLQDQGKAERKRRLFQKQLALREIDATPSLQPSGHQALVDDGLGFGDIDATHADNEEEKRPGLLPVVGFTSVGHDWHTYIAWDVCNGEERSTKVIGPTSKLAASTRSHYDIFKLLSLLDRARSWAENNYWPGLRKNILEPLLDKYDVDMGSSPLHREDAVMGTHEDRP